jgi:exopolysaccharide biosynthesis WecB/TagA/CpsF family protein
MSDQSQPLFNVAAVTALVAKIRPVGDTSSLLDELLLKSFCIVSFVNAHAVNLACRNEPFCDALRSADVLLRDGAGVKILMRAMRREPGRNMVGTDLIPQIVAAVGSKSVALYGSSAQVAELAAAALRRQGVAPVTHCDGFQTAQYYVERVKTDMPRVLVLGMGMPKQELIAEAIRKQYAGPLLILNGGAILDYMAGRFRRAPGYLRHLGLEWLFRLYLEPGRLWRRYLVGNVSFLARTCIAAFHSRFIERVPR